MEKKRWLSLLLAICMIVGMVPSHAFAAETEPSAPEIPVVEKIEEKEEPVADQPAADDEDWSEVGGSGYPKLEVNVDLTAYVPDGYQLYYFSVTPVDSCTYSFTSYSNRDTVGYLYDADMNQMYYNDDSGDGNNFKIQATLEAGVTYYLGVRLYGGSAANFLVGMDHTYYTYEITKEAVSCAEPGEMICNCTECSAMWYEQIIIEHSYEEEWIEPSCYEEGSITYTCTECGDVQVTILPPEHNLYNTEYLEPTCTEPGGWTYRCYNCDHSEFVEESAYGHSYDAGICWRCGDSPEQSGTCGDNITWTLNPAEGVLRLEGTGAMDNYGWYTPWYDYAVRIIKAEIGEGITAVGESAFASCNHLVEVVLPSTLESIGAYAFNGCSAMTTIQLPEGLTSIGYDAFENCEKLESITLPSTLVEIGSEAFLNSGLKEITIPGSVSEIYYGTFAHCDNLHTVVIGEGVNAIGDYVFASNSKLANVTLPTTLKSLGTQSFEGCAALQSIILPEGLENLGYLTFAGCDLRTVTIPSTVISWSQDCFESNWNLTEIKVAAGNTVLASWGGVVYSKDMTILQIIPYGLKTVTIAPSVTEMYARIHSNIQSLVFLGNAPEYWNSYVDNENNITVYYQSGTDWTPDTMTEKYGYAGFRCMPLADGAILYVNVKDEYYSFENVVLDVELYGGYDYVTWLMSTDGGATWTCEYTDKTVLLNGSDIASGTMFYAEVVSAGQKFVSKTFTVTVYPAVDLGSQVNERVDINVPASSYAYVFFTPTVSDYYFVDYTVSNVNISSGYSVYEGDQYVEQSRIYDCYYLEAGHTYKIRLYNGYYGDPYIAFTCWINQTMDVTIGEAFTYELDGSDEKIRFEVTPTESGWYEFFNIDVAYLETMEYDDIRWSQYGRMAYLEAGKTYYLAMEDDACVGQINAIIRAPQVLELGDTVSELSQVHNNYVHFYFTPEVSGPYYFKAKAETSGLDSALINTENGNTPDLLVGPWRWLEAGVQYMLYIEQAYNDDPVSYTVEVKDMTVVQVGHTETVDIEYNYPVVWEFTPEVSGVYFIETQNAPTNYEFQIWVWVEEDDYWHTYNGGKRAITLNAGQTYYIAFQKRTAGDPLTDVVLSINAPEEFQLGVDYTVDYDANNDHVYYNFTPAETGFYTFVNQYSLEVRRGGENVSLNVNYSDTEYNICPVYLEAGVTYSLDFYCYWIGEYVIRGDKVGSMEQGVDTEASHGSNGKYFAEVTVENADCYAWILDDDVDQIYIYNSADGVDVITTIYEGRITWITANLEPGKYLVVAYNDWDAMNATLNFDVAPDPDEISGHDLIMIPNESVPMSIHAMRADGPCDYNLTFTVSDPSIANVISYGTSYMVEAYAPGTVTITGTTVNGISATITVVVKEPVELSMGVPGSITVAPNEKEVFAFTVPSGGFYGFLIEGEGIGYSLSGPDGWDGWYYREVDGKTYAFANLWDAGQYYLTVTNNGGVVRAMGNADGNVAQTVTVTVNPAVEPNEIILPETMTVFTGNYFTLKPTFDSPWVWTYLDWDYTADNREGYIENYYYSECTFYARYEGTMTITASYTKEDGTVVSGTCVVTILDAMPLELDVPVEITIKSWSDYRVSFTPAESGWYVLNHADPAYVSRLDGEYSTYLNYYQGNEKTFMYLEADEEYTIRLYNGSSEEQTLDVTMSVAPALTLDQAMNMDVPHADYVVYTFIPEESGYYSVSAAMMDCELKIADGDYYIAYSDIYGQNRWSVAWLDAGKTYAVLLRHYYSETQNLDLMIQKSPTPESIGLNLEIEDQGMETEVYRFWVNYNPFYTRDLVFVTSSDESILAFKEMDGDFFLYEAVGEGTVTVTATTAGGLEYSLEILVKDPVELELNTPVTVELEYGDRELFTFTAAEAGWYILHDTSSMSNEGWNNYYDSDESGKYLTLWLSEGETYRYTLINWGEEVNSATVEIRKAAEPTAIILPETMTVFTGTSNQLMLQFASFWEFGEVEWTMDCDGDVAWDQGTNAKRFYFYANMAGTFTVTATYGDLTATCVVTVMDALPLELNVPATIEMEGRSNFRLSFTPDASGMYQLNLTDRVYLSDMYANGEYFSDYTRSGNTVVVSLEAGVEYVFRIYNDSWEYKTFDVSITELSLEALEAGVQTNAVVSQNGQTVYFSFVPATSGVYYFTSYSNRDTVGYLYDSQMNELQSDDDNGEGNNFYISRYLEAGETYILAVRYYSSEYTGSIPVIVDAAPAPSEVYLHYDRNETGGVGDTYRFWIGYEPWNAWDEVLTMTSSDESILAYRDHDEYQWYFEAMAEGTVTMTVTTVKGLTASIEVTVKNPTPLTFGQEVSVELAPEGREYYIITVEEEGYYGFLTTGGAGVEIYGGDNYFGTDIEDGTQWGKHFTRSYLYEGTYLVALINYSYEENTARTISFLVDSVAPAESISLPETIYGFLNYGRTVFVDFGSIWNFSPVNWTVEQDNEILEYGFGPGLIELGFVAQGTATVTATTESGLSATMTVIVVDALELELNQEHSVTLSPNGSMIYKFIPTEDMLASLSYGDLNFDGMWRTDGGYVDSMYGMFWLEAGVEYRIRLCNWSNHEKSGTVYLGTPTELVKDAPVQAQGMSQSFLVRPTVTDWYMIKIDQAQGYSAEFSKVLGFHNTEWQEANSYAVDGCRYVVVYLEAGCEYIVHTYAYSIHNYGQYTGNILLTDCVEPAYIEISMGSTAVLVNGSTYWYVQFSPNYARDNVTVIVEDPTIVQVECEGGRNYRITGLADGSTTITFVTDGGLSVSRTISVVQPVILEEATAVGGTLNNGQSAYFQLVTPVEGFYAVGYPASMELVISGEIVHYESKLIDGQRYLYFYAPADETVMVELRNYDQSAAYELEWRRCTNPTALIVPEIINMVVDGSYSVNYQFGTPWEYSDWYISIETDNDGIWTEGRWIHAVQAGVYTVRYVCHGEEGAENLTATSTVIVTEAQQIQLNQDYSVILEPGASTAMTFEIDEVGVYMVSRIRDVEWSLEYRTESGWMYQSNQTSVNGNRIYILAPGTYRFTFSNNMSEMATTNVAVHSVAALEMYESVPVQLDAYDGRIFSITPETSGKYVIAIQNLYNGCGTWLFDSKLSQMDYTSAYGQDGNNRYLVVELEAGVTYYLVTCSYSYNTSFDVMLMEPQQPESMALEAESYNITRGHMIVGDWLYLRSYFDPAYCTEQVTFTFSDDSMVKVQYQGEIYVELELLKAGELTITATSESGLQDTFTVIVVEPMQVELKLDQPQTITIQPGEAFQAIYNLPDEAYGQEYFVYYMTEARLTHKNLGYGGGGEYSRTVEGYDVTVQSWSLYDEVYFNFTDNAITIEIGVTTPVAPQRVELAYNEMSMIVDGYYGMSHTFYPFNAWSEVEWTTSNPDVVEVWNNEGYGGELYALTEGSAVITVTAANGVSDSCAVTVKYPTILGDLILDQYVSYEMLAVGDYPTYTFTAPADGIYFFAAMADRDAYLALYDTNWEFLGENDDYWDLHSGLWYHMAAGETIIVMARPLNQGNMDTLTVVVSTHDDVYQVFTPGIELSLGEKSTGIYPEAGEYVIFKFTPEATGWYAFHNGGESAMTIEVLNATYESYVDSKWIEAGEAAPLYLEAGCTYQFYTFLDVAGEAEVWIDTDVVIPKTIKIITAPNLTTFVKGQTMVDLAGLVLEITWSDGAVTTHSIDEEGYWVEQIYYIDIYDVVENEDGTGYVTIGLSGDCVATYEVTLIENPIQSFEIINADKIPGLIEGGYGTLHVDGTFNYSTILIARNIRFLVTYTDGSTATVGMTDKIMGYDIGSYAEIYGPGKDNFVIYNLLGHEVKLELHFVENPVKSIEIVSMPDALVYGQDGRVSKDEEGEIYFQIDWANGYQGMVIRINYTDGTSKDITYADMTYPMTGQESLNMPEYGGYPVDVTYYLPEYGAEFAYWIGGRMYPNKDGVVPMTLHYMGHYVNFDLPIADNNGSVTIIAQPQDVKVAEGETATVTVEAIGDGLTYQWYYKNADGSKFKLTTTFTGNTYSTEMTADRDGRQVYCVITDKYGNSVQSDVVTLSMEHHVTIVTQPQDVTVAEGETATVTVEATGDGLTYAWYWAKAGSTKFNLTTTFTGNTYTMAMTPDRAGRQIYCVVTDEYGNSVKTNTVTLNMEEVKTPLEITKQPENVEVAAGEMATVTVEATGDGLTYAWYYKDAGSSKFRLTTSFTGNTYSVEMTAARNGRQIYCVITDQYDNSVTTETVTLTMKEEERTPLEITKQPESVEVAAGETVTITVEATGDGLTYAWYYKDAGSSKFRLTTSFTGNTYSVEMTAARNGRQVYCVITDQYDNTVTTEIATMTMKVEEERTPLEITKQPENVVAANGEEVVITVEATGDGLTYAWYWAKAGSSKFSLTTTFTGNTYTAEMSAARDGRQVYCVVTDKYGNSVKTDVVTMTMKVEEERTPLEITKQPENVVAANGEEVVITVEAVGEGLTYAWYYKNPGSKSFKLTTTFTGNTYTAEMSAARDGRQVYCVVTDKYGNSVKTEVATMTMSKGVEITKQPADVVAANGEEVVITVEAVGEGLTYAWYYKNPGSKSFKLTTTFTGNTYTAEMSAARDGRQVYCVVTDKYGNSVQTDTVTMTIK